MGNSTQSPRMEDPVVVHASTKQTATVIFLHGLGDTGHSWSQAFAKNRLPHVKYICPTASCIPVTWNGKQKMPAWFDIRGLDPSSNQDEEGIRSSAQLLQTLVEQEERNGIERARIIVGGFSQGGAVALFSSFALAQGSYGGVIALSSWLPLHTQFPAVLKSNKDTPILQCHGQCDPMVPHSFGRATADVIQQFNTKLEFRSYPNMAHNSCDEEMQDVRQFISRLLPPL